MVSGASWHVPSISKRGASDPNDCLNVMFLQRVSDEEQSQVIESLQEVDEGWVSTLDAPKPQARRLETTRWVRDGFASSDVILTIARAAYSNAGDRAESYRSLILVDSGWEAGNVIAARWEGEEDDRRLIAARVRTNIAESLLSLCDQNEGYTLAHALGDETFEAAKVDFYIDASPRSTEQTKSPEEEYKISEFFPQDMSLSKTEVQIVSLRHLEQAEIESLLRDIINGHQGQDEAPPIKIHNWHGPYIPRTEIRKFFYRVQQNSSETDRDMPLFLTDALLENLDGNLQLISASDSTNPGPKAFQIMPVYTSKLLKLWKKATQGLLKECFDQTEEYADVVNTEYVFDLHVHKRFDAMEAAPVFYLHPFSLEQERIVRKKLCEPNHIGGEREWVYFGYIFPDSGQKHDLEGLRDLFESCDDASPSFDPKKPGPYRLSGYPDHFIAVDDHIFEPEPKVWLASSLDFSLEDTSDELGWLYGLVDAKDAHIVWVGFDVANSGPDDTFFPPRQLWLSDLKEAKKEWEELQAEDYV